MEAGNRIPAPSPTNPTPYCDPPPCPPGSTNPEPPCEPSPEPCDYINEFTENWQNANGRRDIYDRPSSLWYDGNPYSSFTIDIANERYHNTFNDKIPSGSEIRRTPGYTGPFTSIPTPSKFFVITDPDNEPGKLIPGTDTITRQMILNDLINGGVPSGSGFEYNFSNSNNPVNLRRRDSVWVLSTAANYKPEVSIKWNSGSGSYNGSGTLSGWRNGYDLKITPRKLVYGNTNPSTTAVSTNLSSGVPSGLGFQPQTTTTRDSFVDFTTRYYQTQGLPSNNPDRDHLLSYSWEFYWQIDVSPQPHGPL